MKVGEIFWVEFAARGGDDQPGSRPFIIAQKNSADDSAQSDHESGVMHGALREQF